MCHHLENVSATVMPKINYSLYNVTSTKRKLILDNYNSIKMIAIWTEKGTLALDNFYNQNNTRSDIFL
jgi:hypothetical protein